LVDKPSVLVIGGGVAGIQVSTDLANRGLQVYLVEKLTSIGGRMAQFDKTYPTLDCSICILAPKMIDCFRHPNIKVLSYSEVKKVSGKAGDFTVEVLRKPRYVDEARCTGCGQCAEKCPKKIPNEWELSMADRKAVYMPFPQAVPRLMTIDPQNCLYLTKGICRVCEKFCQAKAIDFSQKPETVKIRVASIVLATGFDMLNPSKITEYGYGKHKNVITSLEFERLICASGPTGGHLVRPSDHAKPKRVAFILCVGSRDVKEGMMYCSNVCCLYSAKDAILVKEHEPDVDVVIFYTDLRAYSKGSREFIDRAISDYGIKYIRGRPGEVREDQDTKSLTIWYEDTLSRKVEKLQADLVVLSTACVPSSDAQELAKTLGLELDEYGFFRVADPLYAPLDTTVPGVYACGFCTGPKDISDSVAQASGVAAKAAEVVVATSKGSKTAGTKGG